MEDYFSTKKQGYKHFGYFYLMYALSRAFRFYINASIHVALAVCSLIGVTAVEFHINVPTNLYFFVFFGTITGYNFVKYAEIAGIRHKALKGSLKSIQLFSLLSFCGMLYFAVKLSNFTVFTIGIFAVITFFYSVPLLKHKNLRALGGLKIFIVALVWAGVTVIVPIVAADLSLNMDHWITFIQRFLIVVALTIPFDIRDINQDVSALQTLPQQMGINNVKFFGVILIIATISLALLKPSISAYFFTGLLATCIIISGMLYASKVRQHKFFASFWVEGIPIFWILMLLIGS